MTNQPKKPKKPSPRKFTRDIAGCRTEAWDKFRDKYYPNQDYIPVTEENFCRWCKEFKQDAVFVVFALGNKTNPLTKGWSECLHDRYRVPASSDEAILACIFALQVQGVFR